MFRRLVLTALIFLVAQSAFAAGSDACLGPVARAPMTPDGTPIRYAALGREEVRITFVGHATFTIESPQGVVAATDFNDYVRPPVLPDIATMNHAHSTHYTHRPAAEIRHVLRGWSHQGRPPSHDVQERDLRIRNVPTNIRDGGATEYSGNSIFIFEVAGLCIAHLGHLHHLLTPEHLKAIGKVDIVMAAVDGSWTLDLDGIEEVIRQLDPKVVIPMHFITSTSLERFLSRMRGKHPIEQKGGNSIVVSRANLPDRLAIMVLEGH
ncbi:MAG TPA: MBL fold metallo-hydrolase [Rhabdaerophilum sp.]|nr:MBL fold metallo-hydrolase [Rhabdaerophilum sp.]